MYIKKIPIRSRVVISAITLSLVAFFPIINKSYSIFLDEDSKVLFLSLFIYLLISVFFISWITGFKVSIKGALLLFFYPFISIIPIIIFILNFDINGFEAQYFRGLILICFFSITLFLNYLLLLIVNILNGAASMFLPLAQVAKSAQFIFSLVSVYILTFFFYTNISTIFILAIFLLVIFVFLNLYVNTFFTHEFGYLNANVDQKKDAYLNKIAFRKRLIMLFTNSFSKDSFIEASLGSLIMVVAFVGLAIWPIDIIYKTLSISLIFYLIFNSVLESKLNKSRSIWREYVFIIIVIFLALLLNSFWGVNGSILI